MSNHDHKQEAREPHEIEHEALDRAYAERYGVAGPFADRAIIREGQAACHFFDAGYLAALTARDAQDTPTDSEGAMIEDLCRWILGKPGGYTMSEDAEQDAERLLVSMANNPAPHSADQGIRLSRAEIQAILMLGGSADGTMSLSNAESLAFDAACRKLEAARQEPER